MEPAEIKKMAAFRSRMEGHVEIRHGLTGEARERAVKAAAKLLDVSYLKQKNRKVRVGGSMAKARSPVYAAPREGESGFTRAYMSVYDVPGARPGIISAGARLDSATPRYAAAHLASNGIIQSDLVVNARNSNRHVDTRFQPTESGSLGQVAGIAALEFDAGEVAEGVFEKWLFVRMPGDVFSGSHDLLSGLLVLAADGFDAHLVAHSDGPPPPLLERAAHGRRGIKHGAAVVGSLRGKPLHVYEMDRSQNPLPVIFSPPTTGYVVLASTHVGHDLSAHTEALNLALARKEGDPLSVADRVPHEIDVRTEFDIARLASVFADMVRHGVVSLEQTFRRTDRVAQRKRRQTGEAGEYTEVICPQCFDKVPLKQGRYLVDYRHGIGKRGDNAGQLLRGCQGAINARFDEAEADEGGQ